MDWDRIAGNWKQIKGRTRQRWGRLTGELPQARGLTPKATQRHYDDWLARQHKSDPIYK
jgi:uncharacterized protein YjbJ (UPF0337 family)